MQYSIQYKYILQGGPKSDTSRTLYSIVPEVSLFWPTLYIHVYDIHRKLSYSLKLSPYCTTDEISFNTFVHSELNLDLRDITNVSNGKREVRSHFIMCVGGPGRQRCRRLAQTILYRN